ncbi:UDP-glucose 4-epimerase GalE [Ectobacillus ponti]|uniref:UDP-glucose 4-epimerase n=1 Tax=Ectobacillus ponti TaxID=2961894 RepID=A0AA42BP35_9BACI|nr:UDP-glucose 4-epimerase GalE [Ectobacillus ponti]MCP8968352.1 UDP-glucose 4-epimerase GalE [Ectobacillus ponti]
MILVTGGAGYIGSHAVKSLLQQGFRVVVLDNLSTGHRWAVDKNAVFIEGDVGDAAILHSVFTQYPVKAVMHFAASCLVGESVREPLQYYENNVVCSFTLLKAMLQHHVRKIILSSTCAVYGIAKKEGLVESSQLAPINPYGHSKRMIEQMLADFSGTYGLQYVILRYFNVAGAAWLEGIGEVHDPETHLIPNVLLHLLGGKEHVTVFGNDFDTSDGTCVRDYIHVLDLIEAHVLSLKLLLEHENVAKIYNLGTNTGYSVQQIIEACERITHKKAKIVLQGRRLGDPAWLVASAEKIRQELGWRPKYSLEDMIASAWEWHSNGARKHKN